MEKERRELYIEGVAIHGGPESCAGVREGVGEALIGVRVGGAIEPRNQRSGVPTPYNWAEGNIVGRVFASGRRSWWREGGWTRGTRAGNTRSGRRAGKGARQVRWIVCAESQARTGMRGSRRFCTTSASSACVRPIGRCVRGRQRGWTR